MKYTNNDYDNFLENWINLSSKKEIILKFRIFPRSRLSYLCRIICVFSFIHWRIFKYEHIEE